MSRESPTRSSERSQNRRAHIVLPPLDQSDQPARDPTSAYRRVLVNRPRGPSAGRARIPKSVGFYLT
jgi:hypothetical protein